MDEKDFKKHLRELVRGHHNPAEHDWAGGTRRSMKQPTKGVKRTARKKSSN